jgi:hypothetical protein
MAYGTSSTSMRGAWVLNVLSPGNSMKKLSAVSLAIACALAMVGCSAYASVSATADGKALVAKNGLFGKDVYVCAVTPAGLTNCQASESP